MRKRRGMSIIELITGASVMMLVTLGAAGLLVHGLRSFRQTTSDVTITYDNAQGLRRISEMIRESMSAGISETGTRIVFVRPAMSGVVDPITGEQELSFPVVSDGVARGYKVNFTNGTLFDTRTNTVHVRNIATRDPDPQSSTYGQTYQPFVFSSVGSRRVVLINLITAEQVNGRVRYQRMKNTVLLRNTPW